MRKDKDLIKILVCLYFEYIQNLIFKIMSRLMTNPVQDPDKKT